MSRDIRNQVVVITGASSGIGRAAAHHFARRGARLALAARNQETLDAAASECREYGARAIAVPTDVTQPPAVDRLAERAVEEFGRLDVWVNNAAVTLFGAFDDLPLDDFRRVIETNLYGYVYGAHAALPYFRRQGAGVLINVASLVGKVGQPYSAAYAISKFGILGFSKSLREELRGTGIHVCDVLPASIDTPLFQHGANYMGRLAKPMPPIYDASLIARAIVSAAEHPRPEICPGAASWLGSMFNRLCPQMVERIVAGKVPREHFQDRPAAPSQGNLYQPAPELNGVSGGWRQGSSSQSVLQCAALSLGVAALPAVAGWLLLRK